MRSIKRGISLGPSEGPINLTPGHFRVALEIEFIIERGSSWPVTPPSRCGQLGDVVHSSVAWGSVNQFDAATVGEQQANGIPTFRLDNEIKPLKWRAKKLVE